MFSNQLNYILPLCNTYILFCSELKDTICSCDKQKYYQPMGERQSAKLEKSQTLLYYKESEVSMFLRSPFLCALDFKRIGRNITAWIRDFEKDFSYTKFAVYLYHRYCLKGLHIFIIQISRSNRKDCFCCAEGEKVFMLSSRDWTHYCNTIWFNIGSAYTGGAPWFD